MGNWGAASNVNVNAFKDTAWRAAGAGLGVGLTPLEESPASESLVGNFE
jgi:hypothetical protein